MPPAVVSARRCRPRRSPLLDLSSKGMLWAIAWTSSPCCPCTYQNGTNCAVEQPLMRCILVLLKTNFWWDARLVMVSRCPAWLQWL